jgi:mRNA-degrading endonuclease toxin of MazEF toxin-antitoxin module
MEQYDAWNKLKKKLNTQNDVPNLFPQEGEVWIALLGKNIGREQNGGNETFSRPVLILTRFNNHMFWCVPLSSKQKELDFYFNFTNSFGEKQSAILAQLKLISVKRLTRMVYTFSPVHLQTVKKSIKTLLG